MTNKEFQTENGLEFCDDTVVRKIHRMYKLDKTAGLHVIRLVKDDYKEMQDAVVREMFSGLN